MLNSLTYAHTESFTCKCATSSSAATLNTIPEKVCVQQAHGGVQASLFLPRKACCPRVGFNDVLSLHGEYSLPPPRQLGKFPLLREIIPTAASRAMAFLVEGAYDQHHAIQGILTPTTRLGKTIIVGTAHS